MDDKKTGPRLIRNTEVSAETSIRAANDPGGPAYEPLPPVGRRSFLVAAALSGAWILAALGTRTRKSASRPSARCFRTSWRRPSAAPPCR